MSKRKLWCTEFTDAEVGRNYCRHPSELAVYRYIREQRKEYRAGTLGCRHILIRVDERDGFGWRTYEHVDLADGLPVPAEPANQSDSPAPTARSTSTTNSELRDR